MKKILIIMLIFCFGVIGTLISIYGEEELDLARLLKGEKIISPTASYESGKAVFNPAFAKFLDKLAEFLSKNQGLVIEIGGHTDNSGSQNINQKLSLSRAQRVKDYLVHKSASIKDRILIKGYSSRLPIADNNTAKGRARNRRVEIITLKNVDPAGRLTYIRRDVFTKSPDKIDFTRAIINQDLYHLYRVLTRKRSNANVMFQDLSKINLGPQSLMIMYSLLERGLRIPRKQNVHLLTGGLRTKLKELKGDLQVDTPACVINSNSVEILVGIDEKKMSALSVFDGESEVKAQGKSVAVPEGYGTTVEMGEPPGPAEPLPKPPRIIRPVESVILLPGKSDTQEVSVQFSWFRVEERYHLQVASDSQFEQILEDQTFRDDTAAFSLGRGTYYWRVAAINKRGIEGYSSQSYFTITGGQSNLPFEITPRPRDITDTIHQFVTIFGKTVPGARLTIKGQTVQTNEQGEFSGTISLIGGWNHIRVEAVHPDFKEKVVWLSFYRHAFCSSAIGIGLRFDYAAKNNELDNSVTFQVGTTFCLDSRFEPELSLGLTRLSWDNFPGVYKKEATAIPFTAALRFMLIKGKVIPYLVTGLTTYLTFAQRRDDNTTDTLFFISPEIGGGFSFPIFDSQARFAIKYTPFLKKEPFFPEMAHRLAFILTIMLHSGGK